jgi:hypothetical protein
MSSPCKVVVIVDAPGYGSNEFVDVAKAAFEDWKASHETDQYGRYSLGDLTVEVFFNSVISGKCHYSGAEGDSLAFVFDSNYGYLDVSEDRDNLLYVVGDLLRRRASFEGDHSDNWSAMVFCHGESADACAWKIDIDSDYEPFELGKMPFNFERK